MKTKRLKPEPSRLVMTLAAAMLVLTLPGGCDLFLALNRTYYTVTYNGNGNTGGTAPADSTRYLAGATVTVAGQGSLERTGYTFAGWNTAPGGTGTSHPAGSTFTMGSGNATLYAQWAAIPTYTVTYDGNRNSGGSVPADPTRYRTGATVTVAARGSLERTGYTFAGWNTAPGGTGTSRPAGSTFTMGASNVTLYALWAPDIGSLGMLDLGSTATDVSRFNGTRLYSLITRTPGASWQGDLSPTASAYTLETTSASPASMLPEPGSGARPTTLPLRTPGSVYGPGQRAADEIMRSQEATLLKSRIPQADRRLSKTPDAGAPATISIGTPWNNVDIILASSTINTTCRYISDHAYFFVDTRDTAALDPTIATLGAAFDSIYSIVREKFGTENDVDANGKVIIVFTREISGSTLGYFYGGDKYPRALVSGSNEGDIFYLGVTWLGDIACGTLAHEFQHMVYFDQHYNRGPSGTSYTWLNEALSQAAEYYTGYTDIHLDWISHFLSGGWRGLSLTYWTSGNYGYGAIFIRYLIDRFGDTTIKNLCSTRLYGIAAIEAATDPGFDEIFTDFTRALVVSGTGDSTDPDHSIPSLDLEDVQPSDRGGLLPYELFTAGSTASGSVPPYGIQFDRWTGSLGTMRIAGSGFSGTAFGASR